MISWKMRKRKYAYGLMLWWALAGCSDKAVREGTIVFTRIPASVQIQKEADYRYAPEAQIVMGTLEDGLKDVQVLTDNFYAARAPEVSFHGKRIVFSGQQHKGDTWKIWLMELKSRKLTQLTHSRQNCTDPTWLPDGRIAYSGVVHEEKSLKFHAMFVINEDGCCAQRLSYQPHEDLQATVLHDGRILFASQRIFPDTGKLKWLAMRTDGTKAKLFYSETAAAPNASTGMAYVSKAVELTNDKLLFAENGNLVSLRFSRPLHSRKELTEHDKVTYLSVAGMDSTHILAAFKKSTERTFGIGIFNYQKMEAVGKQFFSEAYHYLEPVAVAARAMPKKLPTRVNPEMNTGFMICMDANNSLIPIAGDHSTARIRLVGLEGPLGETTAKDDGSFYLEVAADQPVRIETIGADGKVLRGPSDWLWVRPNEHRGCVGCHENPELAPENRVPQAIENTPVAIKN